MRKKSGVNEVGAVLFTCQKIIFPFMLICGLACVLNLIGAKGLMKVLSSMPPEIQLLGSVLTIKDMKIITPIIMLCVSYFILACGRSKVSKGYLLSSNKYYLVPECLFFVAYWLNVPQYKGSAVSIPIWQHCRYRYKSFPWNWMPKFEMSVPDGLIDEGKGLEVRIEYLNGNEQSKNPTVRSLIIADTYPIDDAKIPDFVKNNDRIVFTTTKENKQDRVRRYNKELALKVVEEIKKAEEADVTEIYLLANTNPKTIMEIMRDAFNDAGRNPIQHLYVYDSPRKNDFKFTTPHKIF